MDRQPIRWFHAVTALIGSTAVAFYLFFQANKVGPLGAENPFAEDSYDAVGSIGFQVARLIGLLAYARALRLVEDPAQAGKARLILRGNLLVLSAIVIALLGDVVAVIENPPPSF